MKSPKLRLAFAAALALPALALGACGEGDDAATAARYKSPTVTIAPTTANGAATTAHHAKSPAKDAAAARHRARGAVHSKRRAIVKETARTESAARSTGAGHAGQPRRPRSLGLARRGYPVVYLRHRERVTIRTSPGGRRVKSVGPRTEFGSRTVFSVARRTKHWAGVDTPYLPNGQLGWVKLDPRRLGAYSTPWAISVDLSSREAELFRGRRVVSRFAVTVGAPGSTTPTGRFAITDTFRGHLNPAYGCCALALNARQTNLPSGWLGGDRIAIHGTYGPVGYAESHGCIRAANTDVAALVRRVPIGSPVFVRG